MKTFQSFIQESAKRYHVDTGPLMKANAWIKRQKLSKMVTEDDLKGENLGVGYISKPDGKIQAIAVRDVSPKTMNGYFRRGLNMPHSFYYDTGMGHKQTSEMITITGFVNISKDGSVASSGRVDMNANTTLLVFK